MGSNFQKKKHYVTLEWHLKEKKKINDIKSQQVKEQLQTRCSILDRGMHTKEPRLRPYRILHR